MAANALVTTRINETVKQEATEVLASMGLSVLDAVRLLLTRVANEKALPFELWHPILKRLPHWTKQRDESYLPSIVFLR